MEIIRSSRTRGTIIREDIENYEIEFYAPHVLEKQLKNYGKEVKDFYIEKIQSIGYKGKDITVIYTDSEESAKKYITELKDSGYNDILERDIYIINDVEIKNFN